MFARFEKVNFGAQFDLEEFAFRIHEDQEKFTHCGRHSNAMHYFVQNIKFAKDQSSPRRPRGPCGSYIPPHVARRLDASREDTKKAEAARNLRYTNAARMRAMEFFVDSDALDVHRELNNVWAFGF